MAPLRLPKIAAPLLLLLTSFVNFSVGSRKLTSLYRPPPTILTYHNGPLLEGDIPVSVLWYGTFSPSQRAIVTDFLLSLTPRHHHQHPPAAAGPSVSDWWRTVDYYVEKVGKKKTHLLLTNQVLDETYSLGKLLSRAQIPGLAARLGVMHGGLAVVLTAADVAVEGFCVSACGLHGSLRHGGAAAAYVWAGDAGAQCPGQCAWPFHRPLYGPQGPPPLVPPNGDVGVDGVVINLATLLSGAVTNPSGGGFYEGEAGAPVEVAGACVGVYGRGAYPGYPGSLRSDPVTRGSYNVVGENGRKYLVPALLDPFTHACAPMA